ncbi:hypothetical protein [Actinopolyspora mortivallis]|uniref:Alpha-amlyase n=1 Tax=Actinopolyspora mortivallis TaxID=33906 RepID=A0A2T0GX10_ACTMO|nr:hypothetical protein [Actinopolyspora mortivallis]PRW63642.1 hypothetical protein CEP50_09260 [Actinopolyspora mortivallis]
MKVRTVLTGTAAALLLPLFGAVPTGAAQTAEPHPGKAAPPPDCVDVTVDNSSEALYDYAHLHNGCSTTQRVKVVVAWAPDSKCLVLDSGERHSFSWASIGRFDGLRAC